MSEQSTPTPEATLSMDESLQQWWQQHFGASLPEDVRSFVRTLVRQEVVRARRAEHLLDDATLLKVRQGRRLCQTQLDSIEQSLDRVHAQQQRIRHFIRLNSELEKQQTQLYDVGKRQATILSEQHRLERYEAFEAVNGRFQRIHTLGRSIEDSRQLQRSLTIDIEEARRSTDDAEKALVIERQKVSEAQDMLYRQGANMAEAARLRMHIDDERELHSRYAAHSKIISQRLQRMRDAAAETDRTREDKKQVAAALRTRLQALEAHATLITKGEGVQVLLDELDITMNELASLLVEQQQATAHQRERNEQLGRLFSQSQELQSQIQARNEEVQGHRRNIAGQDSYTLGRRTMELRSRLQMLETGLSLWRSIAAGYDNIEQKRQIIAQLRLNADHLNRSVDTLQTEVRTLKRQLDDKSYHWTLSKSQNVIEMRADLQEGYTCPVCGATHHPWHSSSISEQNALIAAMKSDVELLTTELASKSERLHDQQLELTTTLGKLAVESDNMEMLLSRQAKDTTEWQTFSRLDRSFAECSPSTNREARTAMMRQLIEKTAIDAEEAEKALDTFNYHLNAINGLSSEVESRQREAAELAVRLNEVNTACQVVAGQVERLNARVAHFTQEVSRRRNELDKLISLPDWFLQWQQSHEGLRLRIQQMMGEWETLHRQLRQAETELTILDQRAEAQQKAVEQMTADLSNNDAADAAVTDIISKEENTLEHLMQGFEPGVAFADAHDTLLRQNSTYGKQFETFIEHLRRSVALETRHSNFEQTCHQMEQRMAAERQELDVWMRQYNANNSPVQFAELERVLADGSDWSQTRQTIRDISIEEATTQARVDNLRAEIIALQAEGLRPLIADGTEEQNRLSAEQEALEAQRREVLAQMAAYEQQIRSHELAANNPDITTSKQS